MLDAMMTLSLQSDESHFTSRTNNSSSSASTAPAFFIEHILSSKCTNDVSKHSIRVEPIESENESEPDHCQLNPLSFNVDGNGSCGGEDDDIHGRRRKVRRSRTTFTTYQLHQLERSFEKV